MSITCIECGSASLRLTNGSEIYPHRPDLHGKNYWKCQCGAYCGCHPGTTAALGNPCGLETRKARMAAHQAFDPIWKRGELSRNEAYKWLAGATGIDRKRCHISMMNAEQARLVLAAVRRRYSEGEAA